MEDWKKLSIEHVTNIEKVVGFYNVQSPLFPYGHIKIKIVESQNDLYYGVANMAVREKTTDTVVFQRYTGLTCEEALHETIKMLLQSIQRAQAVHEDDFVWIDPRDF